MFISIHYTIGFKYHMVAEQPANLAVHSTLPMGSLPSQAVKHPQRATARTLAIQTCSLKAISAPVFTLLSLQPTRHGWVPNRSGNEVLSSLAASDTDTLIHSGPFQSPAESRGTERPAVHCCRLTWDCKANVILIHCSGMHNGAFSGLLRGDLGA